MRKALLTYERQNGLYHSKPSLTFTQREGHQAHNCKMVYYIASVKLRLRSIFHGFSLLHLTEYLYALKGIYRQYTEYDYSVKQSKENTCGIPVLTDLTLTLLVFKLRD